MQQFREVSRTRTIYSTETHTSDFILNTFWNGKPVQFLQERCWVVVTGCQENKACSKVLNFLERLDDRIRCTHKETVAVVKPWKDVGSNKSLGCVFSEKPADWTNAFIIPLSSMSSSLMYIHSKERTDRADNNVDRNNTETGLDLPNSSRWNRSMRRRSCHRRAATSQL